MKAPRATTLAFALLIVFMLTFVLAAEIRHDGTAALATQHDATAVTDCSRES